MANIGTIGRVLLTVCSALALWCLPLRSYAIGACPAYGQSPSCSVLITINPNGSLTFQTDPAVGPYDGVEDILVGVINKSGATVYGIALNGAGIFGFDGDGAGVGGSYAGPGTSFSVINKNSGIVNFDKGGDGSGLPKDQFLWFSLEGTPASINLAHTVTVDPGHGGLQCNRDDDGNPVNGGDTGATGPTNFATAPVGRLTEHALAFSIGTKLQALLAANGNTVTMTRSTDTVCPTLSERVEIANNANSNAFVSIHFNGAAPSANGTQVWYQPSKSSSKAFATISVANVAARLGLANRGPKSAGIDGKNLFVLRKTNMSSVLAEVAFLSNVGDEAVMHNPASINATAAALLRSIESFLNQ